MSTPLHIVLLAAGEGKRMVSNRPKVLAPVGGRPMLAHLFDAVAALEPAAIHCVIGAGAEQVRTAFAGQNDITWAEQKKRLGTGHALAQALPAIPADARVLVLPGDMPLIRAATLERLTRARADLALLSFIAPDPTGYGRILRDDHSRVTGIREQRDASAAEQEITEVNSGVMLARADAFGRWLGKVGRDNAQGEYYLTDCVRLAVTEGHAVEAVIAECPDELRGANNRAQLAELEQAYQTMARARLLEAGVTLVDPARTIVRGQVQAGRDVVVDVDAVLDNVILGDEVSVGAGCILSDCELAPGTDIQPYSVLEGVRTTGACSIGPFARLRPGTVLAVGVKVGNFVEVKNAQLAAGAKASHLSYLGDAEVGESANIGAGTITCNYDGANKHRTEIGEGAFIGSNTALVAPVRVGKNATIGAGSVVNADAPDGCLTVARARQKTVKSWERPKKRSPS